MGKRTFFFLCLWGMILVLTGFNAAFAAEIVSFWICINADLFDFFSPAGFPSAVGIAGGNPGRAVDAEAEAGAEADDEEDDVADAVEGSAVIRSISVVPEESCNHFHI